MICVWSGTFLFWGVLFCCLLFFCELVTGITILAFFPFAVAITDFDRWEIWRVCFFFWGVSKFWLDIGCFSSLVSISLPNQQALLHTLQDFNSQIVLTKAWIWRQTYKKLFVIAWENKRKSVYLQEI